MEYYFQIMTPKQTLAMPAQATAPTGLYRYVLCSAVQRSAVLDQPGLIPETRQPETFRAYYSFGLSMMSNNWAASQRTTSQVSNMFAPL
jgi:hypothetical protein